MNGIGTQKDNGNKEEQKAEKQERKWTGERNLKSSSRDSKAGGDPVSLGLRKPRQQWN